MKNCEIRYNKNSENSWHEIEIRNVVKDNACSTNTNIWIRLLTGAIIGFVNGFWGGGGGMICVPLLTQVIKLPDKNAHATTLLIMLPLSIVSFVVYIIRGSFPWIDALKIGVGFIVGGIIGANILKFINNVWLSIIFSGIIIAGGIRMII